MYCASCQSSNQAEFTSETMIHFSGVKNIDKPGVLVFPRVLVCLDCGSSRFTILGTDLALLTEGNAKTASTAGGRSVAALAFTT
jgi:hypothetical protein